MSDAIKPALTAEEWARGPWVYGWDDESVFVDWRERADNIDRPHAVAAICLHNQPFGFTRQDVKMLHDPYGSEDGRSWTYEEWRELGDRIAALLPPNDDAPLTQYLVESVRTEREAAQAAEVAPVEATPLRGTFSEPAVRYWLYVNGKPVHEFTGDEVTIENGRTMVHMSKELTATLPVGALVDIRPQGSTS